MKRSTPLDRHIGARVKFYRVKKKLTQEALAAQLQTRGCNVTRAMISHMETGYRSASVFEIDALVEIFGIDYNALFEREPPLDSSSGGK